MLGLFCFSTENQSVKWLLSVWNTEVLKLGLPLLLGTQVGEKNPISVVCLSLH